jgi:hypothetical protein
MSDFGDVQRPLGSIYPVAFEEIGITLRDDPAQIIEAINGLPSNYHGENESIRHKRIAYEGLHAVMWSAESPEDLVMASDLYGLMFQKAVEIQTGPARSNRFVGISSFVAEPLRIAASLYTDLYTGLAPVEEVAEFTTPAIRRLLTNDYLRRFYEDSTSYNTPLESYVSNGFSSMTFRGSAERMAAFVITADLTKEGYRFGRGSKIREESYRQQKAYISEVAIEEVLGGVPAELRYIPEGQQALEYSENIIKSRFENLATGADNAVMSPGERSIAAQFRQVYDLIIEKTTGREKSNVTPFTTTLELANIITKQLNKLPELQPYLPAEGLPKLRENDLANLPAAYQRLLFAINPRLLATAIDMSKPLDQASELRKEMILLDTLAIQWLDHLNVHVPTLGDYVMRLVAQGFSDAEITTKVAAARKQRPDKKATLHFQEVQRHNPNTRPSHVFYNRRKAGYGVIS